MYLPETCVVLLNCKAFGGPKVKTRRCILRTLDVVYLIVRPAQGGRGLRL